MTLWLFFDCGKKSFHRHENPQHLNTPCWTSFSCSCLERSRMLGHCWRHAASVTCFSFSVYLLWGLVYEAGISPNYLALSIILGLQWKQEFMKQYYVKSHKFLNSTHGCKGKKNSELAESKRCSFKLRCFWKFWSLKRVQCILGNRYITN